MNQQQSQYPLLRTVSRVLKGKHLIFRETVFLLLLHLLPNIRDLLAALSELGLRPESTWLLHKDYRYKNRDPLIRELRARGFHVGPTTANSRYAAEALTHAQASGQRVLVLEDGGQITLCLHGEHPNALDLVVGSVEQTERGIRNIETLGSLRLQVPVFDIARSALKARHEPPHVARSVLQNIKNLIPDQILGGKRVGVIGYGRIGRAIAVEAHREGMQVIVFDHDDKKLARTISDGLVAVDSLWRAIEDSWLVIGTTGNTSIGEDVFSALRHGCYLASSSSGSLEFDLDGLARYSREVSVSDNTTAYHLEPDGRAVTVLAHGRPVNFHNFEAVPAEIIDLILAAMLLAGARLAEGNMTPGIHSVDELVAEHKLEERFFWLHKSRMK